MVDTTNILQNILAEQVITPLPLAVTPTPLQLLPRLSSLYQKRIWIKRDDLTGLATSGNKIRKLEYTLAAAKAAGATQIITAGGVQSNHCRSTAILGAQQGFAVHLMLRGEAEQVASGNLLLDHMAGASIQYIDEQAFPRIFADELAKRMAHYESIGERPWFIPIGASDGHGVWGYLSAYAELQRQLEERDIEQASLFSATGSGGTLAGLVLGNELSSFDGQVTGLAVCDNQRYFQKKVQDDITHWQQLYQDSSSTIAQLNVKDMPIDVTDAYVGEGYAKCSDDVFSCMETALCEDGILLDPVYTGKAFYGMLREIRSGRELHNDIVFIHTGGAFGLLAQSEQYQAYRERK